MLAKHYINLLENSKNIEIQKYIVEHLKKFDDLLEILKKELSYRENQATYYKNSMLSFKELINNE